VSWLISIGSSEIPFLLQMNTEGTEHYRKGLG
jgi:hypothetical protein